MNNCEKFRNMICEYVDGSLSESDRELLTEHIKLCHDCKTELDMMKKTRACLTNMPVLPLPEGFNEAFRQNLTKDEEKETKEKIVPFYKKWRTYTSVAAVILFVFVLKSGLTDKNVLLTGEELPKQNITTQAKLSMGADNTQADDIRKTRELQNEKADIEQDNPEQKEKIYFVTESTPEPVTEQQNSDTENMHMTDMTSDFEEAVPELASETQENNGIAVASETDEPVPQARVSGGGSAGGGGGSNSAVYKSVYRATDNVATVFVGESDVAPASALFDIMLYTPSEIESILTRNGISDFSIKTPFGEFDGYYVKVEIK